MIFVKSREEVEVMRAAGRIVAEVLTTLRETVRPGVTTAQLDRVAEETARKRGARPAFKGYQVGGRTFPGSLCVSVDDEVVHGMPSAERRLQEGSIISLDFGVLYEGLYADAALTLPVGTVSDGARRLMTVTEEALWAGISAVRAGRRLGDVSAAIQQRVENDGFAVVREFVGHGIGRQLHEEPQVPNFGVPDRGVRLRRGIVLAIEPMANAGGADVRITDNGWTAVTQDGSLSAHFEHTVAVTDDGPDVLSTM